MKMICLLLLLINSSSSEINDIMSKHYYVLFRDKQDTKINIYTLRSVPVIAFYFFLKAHIKKLNILMLFVCTWYNW